MEQTKKWGIILTVLFIAIQSAIMFGLAAKQELEFLRSAAMTTCLWVVYTAIEMKYGLYMSNYIRVVVMLSIICDSFFGYYLEYYITSSVFDKILHIFGTYSFALFFYFLVIQLLLKKPLNRSFAYLFIVLLGISFGTLYELLEFFVDYTAQPAIRGQAGLLDTDLDLLADTIGALFAAIHLAVGKLDVKIMQYLAEGNSLMKR
ncbi:putative membrane protein [Propionispora sp. 2/2-37]|uniref:hypothetical protein n=1 Tax=Propionispora sp. 2/2-37 TaxID=1677858 RepID=UPI0006BB81C9|nr:hypothetical protein [Propionispora sp. 2/2-37]CUH97649.1 putative membrane protein [Propionispora sp. 2/2-37]